MKENGIPNHSNSGFILSLEHLIHQSPLPMGIISEAGPTLYAINKQLQDIWKLDPEIRTIPLATINASLPFKRALSIVDAVFQSGEQFVAKAEELNGSYFDLSYGVVINPENGARNILILGSDVTSVIIAQKEKDKSERQFRELIKQAQAGIAVFSGEELIIEIVNDLWLSQANKTPCVIGLPLEIAVPELASQSFPNLLREVLKTGRPVYGYEQLVMLQREGAIKETYYNFAYSPLIDETGKAAKLISIATEVTEHVKLKQQLAESEEQLKLAIESAEMGTWDRDLKENKLYMSPKSKELWGVEEGQDLHLDRSMEVISMDDRQRIEAAITKAIQTGETYDEVFKLVAKDGTEKWVRGTGKVFYDASGEPKRFVGTNLDITKIKMEEIRKNDFIAIVSHELKTPLASLKSYIQLLESKINYETGSFEAKAWSRIEELITQMTGLISGFLNISQLEAGKLKLKREVFDLSILASSIVEDFKLLNKKRNFNLVCSSEIWVEADKAKIEQVLTNLISNAVKYSPQESPIIISVDSLEDQVRVSVIDKGIGITDSEQKLLFSRFYRIDNPTTKFVSGFGIGLYFASQIVKLHYGTIGVESKKNEGSTFFFTLPMLG